MNDFSDRPGFTITRVFDAPRELVYRMWTDPKYVARWWGVRGSTSIVHELEVRPGGRSHIEMRSASGVVYPNHGEYLEVVENERIVYIDVHPPAILAEQKVPIGIHTITFESIGSQTKITLNSRFESVEQRDRILRFGVKDGIGESLDRLEQLLHEQTHAIDKGQGT